METLNTRGQCATEILIAMFVLTAFICALQNFSRSAGQLISPSQLSRKVRP
jgi:hypothetical protein